jgi:phosphinothricin acetyltransferase
VYVARKAQGGGVGRAVMEALIDESKRSGYWTLQTSIFPENEASLALHAALGFRVVGTRVRIAKRDGLWRDTVLMEMNVEGAE